MRSKPEKFSAVFLFRRKNYDMTDSMEIPLKKKKKGALAFVRRFDSKRFFFSKGGVRLGHHN